MPEPQFQIEDVSKTPRGWRVRTRLQGAHRVRIAFPPGRRQIGSGQVVQILHPRSENPKSCKVVNTLYDARSEEKALDLAKRKAAASQRPQYIVPTAAGYAVESRKPIGHSAYHEVRPNKRKNRNSILGRVGQAALTVLVNRHNKSKRPNQSSGAEQLYSDFHGRAPHEVLELQEKLMKSGEYAALGDDPQIWLQPVSGDPNHWPAADIEFIPTDKVKLAADGTGRQLYLVGGNQKLPLTHLKREGCDTGKRFVPLGVCYAIAYLTEKSFDGFQSTVYAHEFGEETGERPQIFYDCETERLFLSGGAYSIAPYDEKLQASPGIVN